MAEDKQLFEKKSLNEVGSSVNRAMHVYPFIGSLHLGYGGDQGII